MKINEISIDLEMFGARFANLTNDEQAKFFTGLAKELMHWESDHKKEMQFFFVQDELSEEVKRELEKALTCLWWTEDKS